MPINYSKYPPNWKTEIVPAIDKRSKGRCEECGLRNYQTVYSIKLNIKDVDGRYKLRTLWFRDYFDAKREGGMQNIKFVKVVLTVAHLDHDEENHDVEQDRLKHLCQICHLRHNAKEKFRRMNF